MADAQYSCSHCGKPATIHLTQITDSQVSKVHFCEKCAAEANVSAVTLADFSNAVTGLQPLKPEGPACPACGFKENDFQKKSRLGCPVCYETFHAELAPLLRHVQCAMTHTGKTPAGLNSITVLNDTLADARKRIQAAITAEAYEEAARLRDEIRELEEKIHAGEKNAPVKCGR